MVWYSVSGTTSSLDGGNIYNPMTNVCQKKKVLQLYKSTCPSSSNSNNALLLPHLIPPPLHHTNPLVPPPPSTRMHRPKRQRRNHLPNQRIRRLRRVPRPRPHRPPDRRVRPLVSNKRVRRSPVCVSVDDEYGVGVTRC
jgi:hypothetical protein